VTRSDGNLERVEIGSVDAPIVSDGQLVATRLVTAPAHGCDGPIGQEGVDEGFHCSLLFWLSLAIKAKCCNRPAVCDAVALLDFGDFQDCGVAGVWDSDPGDDLRVQTVGQVVGKLDELADEMVDGHG